MLTRKHLGLTLIELLIASTIMGVLFSSVLAMVNHLYYSQTKVENAQKFYQEARYLTDRIALMIRNNTIDYDRYWTEFMQEETNIKCLPHLQSFKNFENIPAQDLLYQDAFYEDVQDLGEVNLNILDTFRGGIDKFGSVKPCTQALQGDQSVLYLINGERTKRTTIRYDDVEGQISLEKEIGLDLDGDGVVDFWSHESIFEGGFCKIHHDGTLKIITGNQPSPQFCTPHESIVIHPPRVKITNLQFSIAPDRDPLLNDEVLGTRIHPHVRFSLESELNQYEDRGFDETTKPTLRLQSGISSRVYGNHRPPHNIYRYCQNPKCE